jgi:hypothetical protein
MPDEPIFMMGLEATPQGGSMSLEMQIGPSHPLAELRCPTP